MSWKPDLQQRDRKNATRNGQTIPSKRLACAHWRLRLESSRKGGSIMKRMTQLSDSFNAAWLAAIATPAQAGKVCFFTQLNDGQSAFGPSDVWTPSNIDREVADDFDRRRQYRPRSRRWLRSADFRHLSKGCMCAFMPITPMAHPARFRKSISSRPVTTRGRSM